MDSKVETYIKWGIGAVAIGLGGFAALFLIKSILALAITVFGGLIIVNGAPVFAQWASQMKIKGVKYLAMKNPVEDLQLLYVKKTEEMTAFANAITEFFKSGVFAIRDYRAVRLSDEQLAKIPEKYREDAFACVRTFIRDFTWNMPDEPENDAIIDFYEFLT